NQVTEDFSRNTSISYSIAAEPGGCKYSVVEARQFPDIRKAVRRFIILRRPAVNYFALGIELSGIIFQPAERAFGVSMAGFMIFPAQDQEFLIFKLLCPEIMIRFLHVINQGIGIPAFRQFDAYCITSIWCIPKMKQVYAGRDMRCINDFNSFNRKRITLCCMIIPL